jgi:hypothetical protein
LSETRQKKKQEGGKEEIKKARAGINSCLAVPGWLGVAHRLPRTAAPRRARYTSRLAPARPSRSPPVRIACHLFWSTDTADDEEEKKKKKKRKEKK